MESGQNGKTDLKTAETAIPHEEYALLRKPDVTTTSKDLDRKDSRVEGAEIEEHGHGIGPDHSTK